MGHRIIRGYERAAEALIPRYEAFSTPELLAPVSHLLRLPARVLDVGAGTGRDAAWLAAQGCDVLAVEPVGAFRAAGRAAHPTPRIAWLDDALPSLSHVLRRAERFELILLHGVWHHLDATERQHGMRVIRRLTAPGGLVVLALRHGQGPPDRPCFEVSAPQTVALAGEAGLQLLHAEARASIQRQNRAWGVTWTWMVLRARSAAPDHAPPTR